MTTSAEWVQERLIAKARTDALEEAMMAVREACGACDGTGHASRYAGSLSDYECEYCGRPRDAIRAAKDKGL